MQGDDEDCFGCVCGNTREDGINVVEEPPCIRKIENFSEGELRIIKGCNRLASESWDCENEDDSDSRA